MTVVLLNLVSVFVLGGFILLGLAVPLFAVWGEFLPRFQALFDPEILAAARVTALQAGLSAAISIVIGVSLALWLPRDSRAVRALLSIPFGVPAVAAAAAWLTCLPRAVTFGLPTVILAHVFFNIPWVTLWVLRELEEVSIPQQEAAATLGASPWNVFRRVTLPSLGPALGAIFAQVFSVCAMSFILVLLLGGGPPVETLETTLYEKIREGGLDLGGASLCAIWQVVITLIPWIVLRRLRSGRLDPDRSRARSSSSRARKLIGTLAAAVFILPYLVLFGHASSLPRLFDFETIVDVSPALRASFDLALLTAVISTGVALLGAWAESRSRTFARVGSLFLVVPSGVSIMVLGLGFFMAYGAFFDPFSASVWPIGLLQAMFFVPVAFRVFQPIGRKRDTAAWEAARTLGASPLKAFGFVEWPRWRGAVISVFALVAGAAFGEVAAVSLFYNENRIPASLLISRWMGQYRFEDAQALSLLLMLISGGLVALGGICGPAVGGMVE